MIMTPYLSSSAVPPKKGGGSPPAEFGVPYVSLFVERLRTKGPLYILEFISLLPKFAFEPKINHPTTLI
jgi:hypothetical protein